MATSEITGQTIFTAQEVIDEAYLRAKIPSELISGEKIANQLKFLWLLLQKWGQKGAPIWKIKNQILPMYQGQGTLQLEVGTVEVLNANLRTLQRLIGTVTSNQGGDPDNAEDSDVLTACTQTAPAGSLTLDMGSPQVITTFGLLPNATGVWDFFYEISQDGVTWFTVETFTDQVVTTRVWQWLDVEITRYPSYQYARIRADAGTTLDVAEWVCANTPQSIPMAPINKDDWFNLPNKSFQGRPVQYWQDMLRNNPVLRLWPIANDAANFQQVEAQCHMRIEDVGTMRQELDLPSNWYDAICAVLAEHIGDTDPDYKGDINRLDAKAVKAEAEAWGSIVAKGPIYIQPNISPYTRG